MSIRLLAVFAVLPACLTEETTTVAPQETPLAEITDAKLDLGQEGDGLILRIRSADCPRIETRVSGYLDDRVGDFDRGGRTVSTREDDYCDGASVKWAKPLLPTIGISTIAVYDSQTRWTFAIDRPAVLRTLALVEPRATYRAGDTLVFRLNAAAQMSMAGTSGWMVEGGHYLFNETAAPITIDGDTLSLTLPAVAEITQPTQVKLNVHTRIALPVHGCTAPGGCSVGARSAAVELTITLEP